MNLKRLLLSSFSASACLWQLNVLCSKPLCGDYTSTVNALNVFRDFQRDNFAGTILDPTFPNSWINQVAGVHILKSNVEVGFSQFENISANPLLSPTPGSAVAILSNCILPAGGGWNNYKLTVLGNGKTTSSPPIFRNCATATVALGSCGVNITNCYTQSCDNGFFVETRAGQYPNSNIAGNLIKDNHQWAIHLSAYELGASQTIKAQNNIIEFDELGTQTNQTHGGISCSTVSGSAFDYTISGNIITQIGNNSPNLGFQGIYLSGVNKGQIKDNTIADFSTVPSNVPKAFGGIFAENALNISVENNTVNGNSLQYAPFLYFRTSGLYIENCDFANIQCNTVNNINNGISFQGNASQHTDLKYNTINSHNFGLNLDFPSKIGPQDHKDNVWNGSVDQTEAIYRIPGWPNSTGLQQILNSSPFEIGSSNDNPNSSRWANPRLIKGTPGGMDFDDQQDPNDLNKPHHLWFKFGTPTLPTTCSQPFPNPPKKELKLTKTDEDVIAGLIEPIYEYAATVWDAQLYTYTNLLHAPELRPVESVAKTWYDENANSSFARLAVAYEGVKALGTTSPALNAAFSNLNSITESLRQKQLDWAVASTVTEKTQIEQSIAILNGAAVVAKSEVEVQFGAFKASEDAIRVNILGDLSSLALAETYEQDFRTALSTILEAGIASTGFSAAQTATLTNIAQKCRLAGGFGVDIARQATQYVQTTLEADYECGANPRTSPNIEVPILPVLYPNPVNDEFRLRWEGNVIGGQLELVDILGHQLKHWTIEDTDQFLSGKLSLPAGAYFLKVSVIGQKPAVLRFVVSK